MRLNKKLYFFILIPLINFGCTEKYLRGDLAKVYEINVGLDDIYQNRIIITKTFDDPDSLYVIHEKKDLIITSVDTSQIKAFQLEYEHFTQRTGKDVILTKSILFLEFGRVKVKGVNHWFPVKYKGVAYARTDELAFRFLPVFFLKMMKTDSLTIGLDVQFAIGAKGSYSEVKVDGNTTTTVSAGGMTSEAFYRSWGSSPEGLEFLGKYGKQKSEDSDISRNATYLDDWDQRILKSLFDTDKKIEARMRIISNAKK